MQSIAVYLNVDGHVATPVDEYNAVRSTPPALMRGVRTLLCLRLVDTEGEPDDDQVTGMTSWEFALAGDWDTTTDPEILVTEDIAVVQTTVEDKTYNEIQIPLTEMNTEELIEQLGNTAKADLGAELVGFDDGETDPGFLIQFTMRVCNRRSTAGTGTPTQVSDGMYTAAQIDSLMTNYYTSVQVNDALSGYALTNHNHDDVYASISHTHAISEITDLQTLLDAKADVTTVDTHIADTENPHEVTQSQVGLGNVDNTSDTDKPVSTAQQTALDAKAELTTVDIHIADTENPHAVTKAQLSLENVDNTADADKPISTAQQTALDSKADSTTVDIHIADTENPHAVTKAQIELENVDNTADADKPISTAMQTALDAKSTSTFTGIQAIIDDTVITYYATFDEVLAYLNSLSTDIQGVVLNFSTGEYTSSSDASLPVIRLVFNGNDSSLEITGNLTFSRNVVIRDFSNIEATTITLRNGFIENAELTGAVVCGNSLSTVLVNINGTVTINSDAKLFFSSGTISGSVTSAGSFTMMDSVIQGVSSSAVVESTAGYIQISNSYIVNTSTGGCISCDNGATSSAPNMIANVVLMNGTITAGTAVTLLGMIYSTSDITGNATVRMFSKSDIDLGNVDNTADTDKPISTAVQTELDAKLPASTLVPTVAVYIDGNRTDSYTEDGSIAYPYKTIAAATAAHQKAASYFIAKGTYAETTEIDLYEDSIVYGNYSTISGSEINIGEGCFIHNMTFTNTINIAENTDSPMFHYCRFISATLNLAGATDFDGCYIAATFSVTITAAYAIRAFNSFFYVPISGYCQMYFNDCVFQTASTGYVITSTGGLLSMVACMVYNTLTGGGISCDNGADGTSTYNFLVSVATNKDIACGTAVSMIGGDVQYSSLTGSLVTFPARIKAALAAKANSSTVSSHIADTDNPHSVTKAQLSLDNVDNTADTDKPVSTAQQTAIDAKQDKGSSYSLGTALTGALSLDISNGRIQYGALSGATTLAYGSISNLDEAQNFVLQLDNLAGQTFAYTAEDAGSTDILTATDIGIYKLTFSKINSKICFDGKAEVVS